ncbi:MAG: hypothetical protein ABH879_04550 [archaeon]
MRCCFLIAAILALSFASAAEFRFITVENGSLPAVLLTAQVRDQILSNYLMPGERWHVSLQEGYHPVRMIFDDLGTPGTDYAAAATIHVGAEPYESLMVYAVGSLHGTIVDRYDNLVAGARLRFSCTGPDVLDYPVSADEFGSFSLDAVPAGECTVRALGGGYAGRESLLIEQGTMNRVKVQLNEGVVSESRYVPRLWVLVVLGIFAMLMLGYSVFHHRKSGVLPEAIAGARAKAVVLPARSQDIVKTLRSREQKVVGLLVDCGGKTTQSRLHYESALPKVTLSRIIKSLEMKGIVHVKNAGRMNYIELTDWFLGSNGVEQ